MRHVRNYYTIEYIETDFTNNNLPKQQFFHQVRVSFSAIRGSCFPLFLFDSIVVEQRAELPGVVVPHRATGRRPAHRVLEAGTAINTLTAICALSHETGKLATYGVIHVSETSYTGPIHPRV